jgi:hypothetical protein
MAFVLPSTGEQGRERCLCVDSLLRQIRTQLALAVVGFFVSWSGAWSPAVMVRERRPTEFPAPKLWSFKAFLRVLDRPIIGGIWDPEKQPDRVRGSCVDAIVLGRARLMHLRFRFGRQTGLFMLL